MNEPMQAKNWWETDLEWNVNSSLADTVRLGRWLRNIPSTLGAHHLGKASPVDRITPDPVVRMGAPGTAGAPETLHEKIDRIVEERKLTLEQLLDPDFCGYEP